MSEVVKGLEHDEVRPHLIRDLAISNKTQKALAVDYNVSPAAISQFRARHAEEVEDYRETLPPTVDELKNLWIMDRAERLKVMQQIVEEFHNETDVDSAKLVLQALKQAEESAGQAPPKQTLTVTKRLNYTIEGVNLEDLT